MSAVPLRLLQEFTAQPLGLDCKPPALVIVESHSATADLLPKNSILLQKILDLMTIHIFG